MVTYDEIERFLSSERVPAARGRSLESWKRKCKAFGPNAVEVFLDLLRHGAISTHSGALLGLGLNGFETSSWGEGRERVYRVRGPGESQWRTIFPLRQPESP